MRSEILLYEESDTTEYHQSYFAGGADDLGELSATRQISILDGVTQVFTANTNIDLILPAEDSIPDGFPVFVLSQKGTGTVTVKTQGGTTVFSLSPASPKVELMKYQNATTGVRIYEPLQS